MKHHFRVPLTEKELTVEGVLLVKVTVMVGIVAHSLLPAEQAWWVSVSTNLLWLWRT